MSARLHPMVRASEIPEQLSVMQWDGSDEGAARIVDWLAAAGVEAQYVHDDPKYPWAAPTIFVSAVGGVGVINGGQLVALRQRPDVVEVLACSSTLLPRPYFDSEARKERVPAVDGSPTAREYAAAAVALGAR